MSMEKINGSPLLHQGILDHTQQSDRVNPKNAEKAQNAKATDAKAADIAATESKPATGDTVQISDTAHRLMELRQALETGYAALEGLPDTRPDKVAQARNHLQNGTKDQSAVADKIAAGIEKVFEGMEKL